MEDFGCLTGFIQVKVVFVCVFVRRFWLYRKILVMVYHLWKKEETGPNFTNKISEKRAGTAVYEKAHM
jgi:hypothetical protein